ncbi:MAG TPA: glycosyltransferase [Candidatus Saccharimonadia bacterium]|nr:glycosyltransferase [Candidatus Saccharimonadia bacterium]
MPSIAVVMPAYNAAEWIDETLESVRDQTRAADEIIVVDDGSTDDTAARARAHGVTVLQQINGGPPAAYNAGFDAARSDYVAMCPADDIWHPSKLEWQAQALAEDASIDILFGRARYFGLSEGDHPHPDQAGVQDRGPFLRALYASDLVPAPTAVVRLALHRELGRFDESLPSEDYEFWLRALCAGATFAYDDRVLVRLRRHGGNVSSRALQIWEMNHLIRTRFAAEVGDAELTRELLARDLHEIARCRFGAGHPKSARDAYRAALRHRPTAEAAVGAGLLSVPILRDGLVALNERRKARA